MNCAPPPPTTSCNARLSHCFLTRPRDQIGLGGGCSWVCGSHLVPCVGTGTVLVLAVGCPTQAQPFSHLRSGCSVPGGLIFVTEDGDSDVSGGRSWPGRVAALLVPRAPSSAPCLDAPATPGARHPLFLPGGGWSAGGSGGLASLERPGRGRAVAHLSLESLSSHARSGFPPREHFSRGCHAGRGQGVPTGPRRS